MSALVTVIDYGLGNLFSVTRAIERCGARVKVTGDPLDVQEADRLILPGVGAFADGMAGLRSAGLIEPIRRYAQSNRPFLGICLGMQMMFDRSEEFGDHEGLGLIPGKVVAIPATGPDGSSHKIPHIGWNALQTGSSSEWSGSVLEDIRPGDKAYFVHSYMADPEKPEHVLAHCRYDHIEITAAVRKDNLSGCQFHPEKSAETGLSIIRRFIKR